MLIHLQVENGSANPSMLNVTIKTILKKDAEVISRNVLNRITTPVKSFTLHSNAVESKENHADFGEKS